MSRRARIFAAIAFVLVAAVSIGAFAVFNPFQSHAATGPAGAEIKAAGQSDDIPSLQGLKQRALRQEGQQAVATGKASGKVYKGANGQYAQLAFEGEDQIFTLLGQFGSGTPTHNHGALGSINHGGAPGPVRNQIPQPDRNTDNTTIWTSDFDQAHYQTMLFSKTTFPSMANFYLEESSGKYSVNGYVSNWVNVPNNEAAYGSDYCGSIVCTRDIGRFLLDQGNAWYTQMTATMTPAQIDAFLAPFDVWDRYDYDGDGNFNEPDGYIDHFQSVHAGVGEETGGGAQGTDAIWSHRSYANAGFPAPAGPTVNGHVVPFGGAPLGGSSKWIGDYTIEPENGGVGVFSHEFGHDLGLPDEYDTSGNTGGAENGTAWWTIMSQGSYGTQNGEDLGSAPVHFNAWDKFQLGFLNNYAAVFPGQHASVKLGPAETNTKQAQALFVVLPDKLTTKNIGAPFEGSYFYHSGSGNNLNDTMTRTLNVPAGSPTLSFQGKWHIETCWDYAYVEVSADGGPFTPINTSASTTDNENNQNDGFGITGTSGTPKVCDQFGAPTWVNVTADLSAYAGKTIQLRFRYETDGAVVGDGIGVDNITVTGLATDGAETDPGWTYAGFVRTDGTISTAHFNAYVAEFRQYRGYDKSLQLGPYQFTTDTLVEHFPYQDGLLISYWDETFADNNVGDHAGGGLILPIDSHPAIMHWSDGSTARPRIQSYDAPFSLAATDAISLHGGPGGSTLTQSSQAGVSTFNDNTSYWVNGDPGDAPANGRYQSEWNSANNPHTGTTISIQSIDSAGFMQVRVN